MICDTDNYVSQVGPQLCARPQIIYTAHVFFNFTQSVVLYTALNIEYRDYSLGF